MKKILWIAAALLAVSPLAAQNATDAVLRSVEENNTTLRALREEVAAEQLANKTDIFLPGPDVEFSYLWGSPGGIGNRNDIRVTQSFDIATISGMKNRLADDRNRLVGLQYKSERIKVLLEAKQYCIELTYYNALRAEVAQRLRYARTLAEGYGERLERGDANRLEYNKAQLNLSAVEGEMARIEVERAALLSQLARLNGGAPVRFDDMLYGAQELPSDFEAWYADAEQQNPLLQYVRTQVEVSKKEVKLNKTQALPTFSAGYMREKTLGQAYQGVTVGMSIPLWGNKNKVKQAKTAVIAAEARQEEARQQFYDQLQTLYLRADGLRQTAAKYRASLSSLNNTELLAKALNAGEISLLDYIVEIGLYYDTVNQALSAERDYRQAFADLSAVEL